MKKTWLFLCSVAAVLFWGSLAAAGPYAPAAGQDGSTAIHMDDAAFVAWATGWTNYTVGQNVSTTYQTPDMALGKAVGGSYDIVCLGDGGSIILTFDTAIRDGDGWDFAVFENSFSDTFLELAYVEVSSDGVNFFRFQNDSLTSGATGGSVDPTDIDGYAGKYKQGYGTPFDLADLAGTEGLDINNIGWVKILDIVGDGSYLDTSGNEIYDPHPTGTISAGFDLDGIGVINAVPLPGSVWLLLSGCSALLGLRRRILRR